MSETGSMTEKSKDHRKKKIIKKKKKLSGKSTKHKQQKEIVHIDNIFDAYNSIMKSFGEFLYKHNVYESVPENAKILIFNSELNFREIIKIFIKEDIYCSLIYDSACNNFIGVVTINDIIRLFKYINDKFSPKDNHNEIAGSKINKDNNALGGKKKTVNIYKCLKVINYYDYYSIVKNKKNKKLYTAFLDDSLFMSLESLFLYSVDRLIVEELKKPKNQNNNEKEKEKEKTPNIQVISNDNNSNGNNNKKYPEVFSDNRNEKDEIRNIRKVSPYAAKDKNKDNPEQKRNKNSNRELLDDDQNNENNIKNFNSWKKKRAMQNNIAGTAEKRPNNKNSNDSIKNKPREKEINSEKKTWGRNKNPQRYQNLEKDNPSKRNNYRSEKISNISDDTARRRENITKNQKKYIDQKMNTFDKNFRRGNIKTEENDENYKTNDYLKREKNYTPNNKRSKELLDKMNKDKYIKGSNPISEKIPLERKYKRHSEPEDNKSKKYNNQNNNRVPKPGQVRKYDNYNRNYGGKKINQRFMTPLNKDIKKPEPMTTKNSNNRRINYSANTNNKMNQSNSKNSYTNTKKPMGMNKRIKMCPDYANNYNSNSNNNDNTNNYDKKRSNNGMNNGQHKKYANPTLDNTNPIMNFRNNNNNGPYNNSKMNRNPNEGRRDYPEDSRRENKNNNYENTKNKNRPGNSNYFTYVAEQEEEESKYQSSNLQNCKGFITYESIFVYLIFNYYNFHMTEFNITLSDLLKIPKDTSCLEEIDFVCNVNNKVYVAFEKCLFFHKEIIPVFNANHTSIEGFMFLKDYLYYISNDECKLSLLVGQFLTDMYKGINEEKPYGKDRIALIELNDENKKITMKELVEQMYDAVEKKIVVHDKSNGGNKLYLMSLKTLFRSVLDFDRANKYKNKNKNN